MDKEKFNRYCAEVMGYSSHWVRNGKNYIDEGIIGLIGQYEPHDDLNQASKVFDKLMSKEGFLVMKFFTYNSKCEGSVEQIPVGDAIRSYIISTMPEDKQ